MKTRLVLLIVSIATMARTLPAAAEVPASESIVMQQTNGAYVLTVPVSDLEVSIPRGTLAPAKDRTGGVDHPRYFFLEDTSQPLIVSGWFEPGAGFTDIRAFWDGEMRTWREQGLQAPRAVSFARISDWEAVIYEMALPSGTNSHIRAHWVQDGTWIDLHLSVSSDRTVAENRSLLKTILKSIRVRRRR